MQQREGIMAAETKQPKAPAGRDEAAVEVRLVRPAALGGKPAPAGTVIGRVRLSPGVELAALTRAVEVGDARGFPVA
jgi:hypothetical protein